MGLYKKYFKEVTKNEYFTLLTTIMILVYFFTNILITNTGHLLAFLVSLGVVFLFIDFKEDDTSNFYNDLDNKIKNLTDKEELVYYFYIDPDVIVLFDEINYDFSSYNKNIYEKALKAANNILFCRKAIETKLCQTPTIPFYLDNFNKDYKLKSSDKCDKIVKNAYSVFLLAEKNYKLCLNFLHSFIYSIPYDPSSLLKHDQMLERARLILKRNLDIIRKIYLKNTDLTSPQITDYDTFVPQNKATNTIGINDNPFEETFNYF